MSDVGFQGGQVRTKIQKLKFASATGEPNGSRCISLLYQGIVFEAAYTFLKGRLKNLFFLAELGPPEVGSRSYLSHFQGPQTLFWKQAMVLIVAFLQSTAKNSSEY